MGALLDLALTACDAEDPHISAREDRLQRVTQQLRERPADRLAFEVNEADPVLITLAIRTAGAIVAAEYVIQAERWDRALFLRTITQTLENPQ